MFMATTASTTARGTAVARSQTVHAAVLAALIGLGIVYLVGFAQPSLLHNATHDSRHSLAFPCH